MDRDSLMMQKRPPTPNRNLPSTPPPTPPGSATSPQPSAASTTIESPQAQAPRPSRPTRKAPTPGQVNPSLSSAERGPPSRAASSIELSARAGDQGGPKPSPPPRSPSMPPLSNQNPLSIPNQNGGSSITGPTHGRIPIPPRPVLSRNLSQSDASGIPPSPASDPIKPLEPRPTHTRGGSARDPSTVTGIGGPAGGIVNPPGDKPTSTYRTSQPPQSNGGLRNTSNGIAPVGNDDDQGGEGDELIDINDPNPPPIRTDFASMRKLDDIPQRAHVVLEILKTEEDYINNVEQMIRNYKGPLMTLASTHPEVSADEIKAMFSNIHLILPLNQELYKDISARIDNWSPTQKLGDVFCKMAPFLKMYTDYSNNYKQALAIYNRYNTESEKFAETCALCKATCKPQRNLESYLINPIQRIPRYTLLIQELLKNTESTHPDYDDLNKALNTMKEVATHINVTVKKTDNLRKLAQASTKGEGFKGLMKAHRQLIKDGVLPTVDNKGHKEKLHFYLFNDIMVFATKSDLRRQKDMTKLNSQWPTNLLWFSNSTNGMELTGPNRMFTISNMAPDELEAWVADFKKVLEPFESEKREGEFDFGAMKYEGEWLKGKIHGNGTLTSFGTVYTGQFAHGKKSGEGTLLYTTNDVYQGLWANDLQNGRGVLTLTDTSKYDGDWKDGKKHGQGSFVYANGDQYVGSWRDDKPHGEGKLYLASGISYEGQWDSGKFHGKGTLWLPHGKTYVGDFAQGLKEGVGIMDYGNGERYEGGWKQDKRHGQGTFTVQDGWETRYIGSWAADKKDGNGSVVYMDGSQYEGGWKNDMPHGKGTLKKANGDVHTGHFKHGVPHGAGVLTYAASGMELTAKWDNGIRESGKVTISRVLTEEEKKIVQANPKGNNVIDKLAGSFSQKECTVSGSYNSESFEVALVPEVPNFNYLL